MSDRVCIRGCRKVEVGEDGKRHPLHYAGAGCQNYFVPDSCIGCVPRECRDGSLICDTCFGKARALLSDAPDLLGRLRSEADAGKSKWNWDTGHVVHSSSVHPSAPVGDDLLDAIQAVEYGMWFFADGIEAMSNNDAAMSQLGPLLLDFHRPDDDGVRESWSMLDALKRWGLERRETYRHVFPGKLPNAPLGSYAKFDEEEEATPIPELHDPFLDVRQAAARAGVGVRAVQKWAKDGHITPVAKLRSPDGNVHTYFRTSDIDKKRTTKHQNGDRDA